MLAINHLGLRG